MSQFKQFPNQLLSAGKPQKMVSVEASDVAAKALRFLASDQELMSRFFALTGVEPSEVRQAADNPGFLVGVLDFVLAHEPTMIALMAAEDLQAEQIANAREVLNG